jgi:hypothetical protein
MGTWEVPFTGTRIKLESCNTDRICGHVTRKAQQNCGPGQAVVDAQTLIIDGDKEGNGAIYFSDPPRWVGKITIYCTMQDNGLFKPDTPRKWDFVMTKVDANLQVCVQTLCQPWKRVPER